MLERRISIHAASPHRCGSVIARIAAAVMLITSLALTGAWPGNVELSASTIETSSLTSYSRDQYEALAYLNEVRAKAGLPAVTLNDRITEAAELHARYFNINKVTPNLSAHNEKAGLPGYRGTRIRDRLAAAGYVSPSKQGYASGEVMHFRQKGSLNAMKGWLDTAYHRQMVLSPNFQEIGIALVGGTAVVNLAGSTTSPIAGGLAIYPYDGMQNTGIGFYGFETPNPLVQFDVEHSGYIISATAAGPIDKFEAAITDEEGALLHFYEEISRDTLFLFPKEILRGLHTYTVSVKYRLEGTQAWHSRTWSFTTGTGSGS
ncbi:hypothetical protein C7121_00630 [Paenibacillus glucanolyticus]|nr:hypothetical protein C7121_00630 [Paenibacillus glucanolyticus]